MKRIKVMAVLLSVGMMLSMAACSASKDAAMNRDDRAAGAPPEAAIAPNGEDAYQADEYNDSIDAEINTIDDEYTFPFENESINQEEYDIEEETPFWTVSKRPLSTFSANTDTASYSNMRRFLLEGQKPEGIRTEELINYFSYDFEKPSQKSNDPFAVYTEISDCPWNPDTKLAMVSIQAESMNPDVDIDNNIVFLIDVSGSMDEPNKLPLLKESFKMLIDELGPNDTISIVTYAGSDEIIADSIPGNRHSELKFAINNLSAGGGTAGAAGLQTAYELANKNFIQGGNNRIIIASDGDFNIGASSVEDIDAMIQKERETSVFISVLGYGMGNYKDNRMETIAKEGNGNYAYIDSLQEAKKVLVDEFDSTMYAVAKDVKFQVEFNPEAVEAYRLLGYNNRRLEDKDFNDDKKDAGEVGAGHTVTVFYELVMTDGSDSSPVDTLKYQTPKATPETIQKSVSNAEFFTVKIRYKQPDGDKSILMESIVDKNNYTTKPSENFNFASSVAEFGLIITDSKYKGNSDISQMINLASQNVGTDENGLRQEFVELVEIYNQYDFR